MFHAVSLVVPVVPCRIVLCGHYTDRREKEEEKGTGFTAIAMQYHDHDIAWRNSMVALPLNSPYWDGSINQFPSILAFFSSFICLGPRQGKARKGQGTE